MALKTKAQASTRSSHPCTSPSWKLVRTAAHDDDAPIDSDHDRELLEKARTGNERSIEALIERYRPFVYFKARDYFLPGSQHDDVIQEGMIGLFKAIKAFDPIKNPHFISFADLCITRQIQTAVKRETRRKQRVLTESIRLDYQVDEDDGNAPNCATRIEIMCSVDPAALVASAQEIDLIREHITQSLTELESEVITMMMKGMSYPQAATILGVHVKRVDNALQRARNKLRSYFQEIDEQD